MKIEQKWIDCAIYIVGFYAEGENCRLVNKILVFDSVDIDIESPNEKIEEYIFKNFNKVKVVDYIDVWCEYALRTRGEDGSALYS